MTGAWPGLILDVVVIALLGITIFYSMRLTLSLKVFRESRAELGSLLEQLNKSVIQADQAIRNLRQASRESGEDIQDLVNRGRELAGELEIMCEAGNSLAERLEALASRTKGKDVPVRSSRRPARRPQAEFDDIDEDNEGDDFIFRHGETTTKAPAHSGGIGGRTPDFAIQDRDFEDDERSADVAFYNEDAGAESFDGDAFESKAEQELFEALQRNKGGRGHS